MAQNHKEVCEKTNIEERFNIKEYLEKIANNDPSLTLLDFSKKNIGDADLDLLLKALKQNSHVTRLNLNENQIFEEGARALATFLKEKNQKSFVLQINDNPLSPRVLTELNYALLNYSGTADAYYKEISESYFKLIAEHKTDRENALMSNSELMKKLLETPQDLLIRAEDYPENSTLAYLDDPYSVIKECQCGLPMQRLIGTKIPDYKNMVIKLLTEQLQFKDRNAPVKLLSIGAMGLFQESQFAALFLSLGFKNVHLDLVDFEFSDYILTLSADGTRVILAYQFLTLLQNLGFKVKNGHNPLYYPELLMQKFGFGMLPEHPSGVITEREKPTLTISFFDSTHSYNRALAQGYSTPDSIVAIDLEIGPQEQEYLLSPILKRVEENTVYFTIRLVWFNYNWRDENRREYFQIEGKVKKANNWIALFEEENYRVRVAAHDPFLSLDERQSLLNSHEVLNPMVGNSYDLVERLQASYISLTGTLESKNKVMQNEPERLLMLSTFRYHLRPGWEDLDSPTINSVLQESSENLSRSIVRTSLLSKARFDLNYAAV